MQSHQTIFIFPLFASRRELVHELLASDFNVNQIATFLDNRHTNQIWLLHESYKDRDNNKRKRPGPRIGSYSR